MMLTPLSFLATFRRIWCLGLLGVFASAATSALHADIEDMAVVGVTDMTEEGRKRPQVTPENPVYYQAVTAGYTDFGRPMAGEREPDHDRFLQVILRALKKQGYLPAHGDQHPTIVLGFSWGSVRGDLGGALAALGGDKLDLMDVVKQPVGLDPKQWLRGLRSEKADRVLEMAKNDLFMMNIVAYDREALIRGRKVPLWHTRISSPARGVWAADALPRIVEVGAPIIGRETKTPELTTVREAFGKEGSIEIGELTVVDEEFDLNEIQLLDMTKDDGSSESGAAGGK
ncbi:hypothetical protein [Actomonas aquatica]|uniref:Uncharacterized protein n=1 Tax=Actomonas aquatica TaxID=2866162 RepID=A0ABZ1C740_9BACT|nr:hypothetical protein [Opitutus sp. WL0086]WRQ87539.1 hypothetical protein K1X11_022210 [Opitutus sp. WL0086]